MIGDISHRKENFYTISIKNDTKGKAEKKYLEKIY